MSFEWVPKVHTDPLSLRSAHKEKMEPEVDSGRTRKFFAVIPDVPRVPISAALVSFWIGRPNTNAYDRELLRRINVLRAAYGMWEAIAEYRNQDREELFAEANELLRLIPLFVRGDLVKITVYRAFVELFEVTELEYRTVRVLDRTTACKCWECAEEHKLRLMINC